MSFFASTPSVDAFHEILKPAMIDAGINESDQYVIEILTTLLLWPGNYNENSYIKVGLAITELLKQQS
jgi:hypothetical protein